MTLRQGDNSSLQPQQKRRKHKNSRGGCLTCKSRHVKCDEQQPTCTTCARGSRSCQWEPAILKVIQVNFNNGERRYDATTETSLDFFINRTIPMLKRWEPSPVWDDILSLVDTDTCLLRVASALGNQHQTLGDRERECVLYARAVSTWRATVGQGPAAQTCLLFVLLSALRGNVSEMCLHLKFGVEHIFESGLPPAWTIYLRPLQKLCLGVVLLNPLAPDTTQMLDIARTALSSHPQSADDEMILCELEDLVMSLLLTTLSLRNTAHSTGATFERLYPTDLKDKIKDMKDRCHALDARIDERIDTGLPQYLRAKSGSLLIHIHLQYLWICHQTAYDTSLEVFRQIVQLQVEGLRRIPQDDRSQAFSLGTGSIFVLWSVVMLCRDAKVRKLALDAIDICPSQDGVWRKVLVQEICRKVIDFEEEQASRVYGYDLCGFIPEHCRVQDYLLVEADEDSQQHWRGLTVFLRPDSAEDSHAEYFLPLQNG